MAPSTPPVERVALEGQRPAVARLPRRAQRVREQRQRAGLAGHLGDEHVDEAGLDAQAGAGRRLGDGPPQLGRRHRAEQDLVAGDGGGQAGVLRAGAVEVGPQADHHRVGPGQQLVEEGGALVVVGALGEQLLELVDDDRAVDRRRARRAAAAPG